MPSVDDLVNLIQQVEAGKNDVLSKIQAASAASAAETAAEQAASTATADRDHAIATQAAKVQQVLAMVQTMYADPTSAPSSSGSPSSSPAT
jgi:hypothetical protein